MTPMAFITLLLATAEGCDQAGYGPLPETSEGQRRRPTSLFSGMQSRVGIRGNGNGYEAST